MITNVKGKAEISPDLPDCRTPRNSLFKDRWSYGEDRYHLLGAIEHRVFVVVYTIRSSSIRIISARKANQREVTDYEDYTGDD